MAEGEQVKGGSNQAFVKSIPRVLLIMKWLSYMGQIHSVCVCVFIAAHYSGKYEIGLISDWVVYLTFLRVMSFSVIFFFSLCHVTKLKHIK